MTSPTWRMLRIMIIVFMVFQVLDALTMTLMPIEAELNPIPQLIGVWLSVGLKVLGGLFCVWLALKMKNDTWAAGTLMTGIAIGSIGTGSNLSVILGMWRLGLL